jgi:hypothetical protein
MRLNLVARYLPCIRGVQTQSFAANFAECGVWKHVCIGDEIATRRIDRVVAFATLVCPAPSPGPLPGEVRVYRPERGSVSRRNVRISLQARNRRRVN